MSFDDIPLGMRLKAQAGWNQTHADWRRFLQIGLPGCFVAEWEGQAVGTTATFVLGSVGWLAMVLVDTAHRNRGIGRRLVRTALEYLDAGVVATARLDATPLGRPIYEQSGFVAEYDLLRMVGVAAWGGRDDDVCTPQETDVDSIVALDQRITGTDRRFLIERLYRENPRHVAIVQQDGALIGYGMRRGGSHATQIGPVMAATAAAGRWICDWQLQQSAEQTVFVDIPRTNTAAIDWATTRGLAEQRTLTRMYRGVAIADDPARLWASSGPEKG